jgi:hypothetical protein
MHRDSIDEIKQLSLPHGVAVQRAVLSKLGRKEEC